FQLDGDAQQATNNGVTATIPGDDWDNVCHRVAPTACPTGTSSASTKVSWVAEQNQNSTIFTGGGSKDPSPIQDGAWLWKDGAGGLPDKDNLEHSFASRYALAPSAFCPDEAP